MAQSYVEDQFDCNSLVVPISNGPQFTNNNNSGIDGRARHQRRLSLPSFPISLPRIVNRPAVGHSMRDAMRLRNNVEWDQKGYKKLSEDTLLPLTSPITAAITGPKEGIRNIDVKCCKEEFLSHPRYHGRVKTFRDWTKPDSSRAFGIATSLYERNPKSDSTTGDPVADVFAIIARENSCILSIADGVNWGDKSRLAARSAVAGSVQYLNQFLTSATTTHDVMELLCLSFELAQECIVQNGATMTTLCTAVICPIRGSEKWAVCMINVGDSLGFVYSKDGSLKNRTREITIGSHCNESERDMRCPGGSLGLVDGYNPDLTNLTFSYTLVSAGDIVFLSSDGVSDNFDPVVSQCNHCKGQLRRHSVSMDALNSTGRLSAVQAAIDNETDKYNEWDIPTNRHVKTLCDMQEAIELEIPDEHLSAQTLCANLISHVVKSTQEKRIAVEKRLQENVDRGPMQRIAENEIRKVMRELPGKLDHAAVVAFEVGEFPLEHLRVISEGPNRSKNFIDNLKGFMQGLKTSSSEDDGKNQLHTLFSI